MTTMTSQITRLTVVYSIVYSDADQRKHQSSASLAFVRGIHRWPVNSPHKGPVPRKFFPFDDVIMKTSWHGKTFRITGLLWGESSDGFPSTTGQWYKDISLLLACTPCGAYFSCCFYLKTNSPMVGELKPHDGTVMLNIADGLGFDGANPDKYLNKRFRNWKYDINLWLPSKP